MTDKKITEEEIKSSLEVIATTRNCNECKIRNCKWGTCNCSQITANAALDLINRQQAEIERLKYQVNRLKNYDERRDIALHSMLIAKAKSEAHKEFAERLKERQQTFIGDEYAYKFIYLIEIDNLVKEMVGETNDT